MSFLAHDLIFTNLLYYWCFVSAFVIFCNNPSIYEVGPKIAVPDKEVQIVYLYYLNFLSARIPEYYLVNICNDSCFLESFHFNCTLCENKKNMSYPKTVVKSWFDILHIHLHIFWVLDLRYAVCPHWYKVRVLKMRICYTDTSVCIPILYYSLHCTVLQASVLSEIHM